MIGQHIFLIETAFVGIVRYRDDDRFEAESIGSHFNDGVPSRIIFDQHSPKITANDWQALRSHVMVTLRQQIARAAGEFDDLKVQIVNNDHGRCTPMVLNLLWQRFRSAETSGDDPS